MDGKIKKSKKVKRRKNRKKVQSEKETVKGSLYT